MNNNLIHQREQDHLKQITDEVCEIVRDVMLGLEIENWPGKWGRSTTIEKYLIWLQWSRKYSISVGRVIKLIVVEYRRRFRKTESNLGISLNVLIAPKVEEWLRTQVKPLTGGLNTALPPLKRYNTIEAYLEGITKARRRNRRIRQTKRYRNSAGWQKPTIDVIRSHTR